MWCVERQIHEERFVSFFCLAHEVGRMIRHNFAPVCSALPESAKLWIRWRPRILARGDRPVVSLRSCLRHTGTNVSRDVERFLRGRFAVPLTGHVSSIAGGLHVLAPPAALLAFLLGLIPDFVRVPNRAAAIEHRAAGHANRTAPRSHVVGVRERCAPPCNSIKVGRLNFVISHRIDRLKTLIVSKDKNDVWLGLIGCGCEADRE